MSEDFEKLAHEASQPPPAPVTPPEALEPPSVDPGAVNGVLQAYASPEVLDSLTRLERLARIAHAPGNLPPPRKPAKRTITERDEDLALMVKLVSQRSTCRDVAAWIATFRPYTISRQQAYADMVEVRQRLREIAKADLEDHRAVELEQIRQQEIEAYAAWEKSKEDETSVTKISGGEDASGNRVIVRKMKQVGDPRWLKVLIDLRSQRMAIQGTAMPVKASLEVKASVDARLETPAMREAYRRRLLAKEKHAKIIPITSEVKPA